MAHEWIEPCFPSEMEIDWSDVAGDCIACLLRLAQRRRETRSMYGAQFDANEVPSRRRVNRRVPRVTRLTANRISRCPPFHVPPDVVAPFNPNPHEAGLHDSAPSTTPVRGD